MIFFVYLIVNGSFHIILKAIYMKYSIKASSIAKVRLRYTLRNPKLSLGFTQTADSVANPAELF
jgi:hypothetical protein